MRVIFLDIDGVLNTRKSMVLAHQDGICPDPNRPWMTMDLDAVARLQRIVDMTGAQIVISSSWRGKSLEDSQAALKALEWAGFTSMDAVIDVTPRLWSGGRGHEIADWLERHPTVTNFVILDDDTFDIVPLFPSDLFNTTNEFGLLDEHVAPVVFHLTGGESHE